MIETGTAEFRIKSRNDAQRIIEGVATTPTPDRIGDIVEPQGAKFKLPMPLLWQHDPNKPIGRVLEAETTPEGIYFRAQIENVDEPGALKDRVDEAWQSVVRGLVRGVSIGFSELERPECLASGGLRFREWSWFELSLVTIPANEEATIEIIKSAALDQRAAAPRRRPLTRAAARRRLAPLLGSLKKKGKIAAAALPKQKIAAAAPPTPAAARSRKFDPVRFGTSIGELLRDAIGPMRDRIKALENDNATLRAELKGIGAVRPLRYLGVWKSGSYPENSVVTYRGSAWCAREDTDDAPGITSSWQLMVKRGRDMRPRERDTANDAR